MSYSQEELQQRYDELPADVRTAMGSVNTVNAIQAISTRHGLHVDQMGILAEEVGLLMLGVKHPREFVPALSARLSIERHKAELIAHDTNEQIFLPVRAHLKELHRLRDDELDAAMRGMDKESLLASIEAPSAPAAPQSPAPHESSEKSFTEKVAPLFRAPEKRSELKADPYHEPIE